MIFIDDVQCSMSHRLAQTCERHDAAPTWKVWGKLQSFVFQVFDLLMLLLHIIHGHSPSEKQSPTVLRLFSHHPRHIPHHLQDMARN